ncbi:MAG: hypothetical protein IJL03_06340 [Lachnospiraceae bacterium]|nr:hypothetical protein [Lachnospiraceae bacterium]
MANQRRHLTKKQFIIGIVALCSIALVIEGILVVRMLTKKKPALSKQEGSSLAGYLRGDIPESYICKAYTVGENGERQLESIEHVDYDDKGRKVHVYTMQIRYYRGDPFVKTFEEEGFYFYDDLDRVVSEEWKETNHVGRHDISGEGNIDGGSERKVSYAYTEDGYTKKTISTRDGHYSSKEEERYNSQGKCVFREGVDFDEEGNVTETQKSEYTDQEVLLRSVTYDASGEETKHDIYEYDAFGNLILREYGVDGKKLDCAEYIPSERKTIYYQGDKDRLYGWNSYDEAGRLIQMVRWAISPVDGSYGGGYHEYDYQYYNSTDKSCKGSRYTKNKDDSLRLTDEYENDSEGKIKKHIGYDKGGEIITKDFYEYDSLGRITSVTTLEGITLYEWNYFDLSNPSKKALRVTEYRGNLLVKDVLYMVSEDCEGIRQLPTDPFTGISFRGISSCQCSKEEPYTSVFASDDGCIQFDYANYGIKCHLELYRGATYDERDGALDSEITSGFDSLGNRVQTVCYLYRNSGTISCTRQYDNRGNLIRIEEFRDYEEGEDRKDITEFEYTYY